MLGVGVAGYLLYWRAHYLLAVYAFYAYAVMNLVVLGHYTPSRIQGALSAVVSRVHVLIALEVLVTLVLASYVCAIHRAIRK